MLIIPRPLFYNVLKFLLNSAIFIICQPELPSLIGVYNQKGQRHMGKKIKTWLKSAMVDLYIQHLKSKY